MIKRELLRLIESRVYLIGRFDSAKRYGHQFTDDDLELAGRAILELEYLRAELLSPPRLHSRRQCKNLIPEKAADAYFKKIGAATGAAIERMRSARYGD